MSKPNVAFFDFACCEGCQLQVANLGETLVDVLELINLVEFREVMSETWEDRYDVAVIEGSITNTEAEEKIKKIRERSNILIAYGACATIGGVNGMKNTSPLSDVRSEVYGDKGDWFDTKPTKAVDQVVKVDYYVHGCPIYPPEFLKVLKSALTGVHYEAPDYAVCVECKFNENVCMYDRGLGCLGPVTRAGCNSWCVNNGNICYGCRGMMSNPNINGATDVMAKHGIQPKMIMKKMQMYNAAGEAGDE